MRDVEATVGGDLMPTRADTILATTRNALGFMESEVGGDETLRLSFYRTLVDMVAHAAREVPPKPKPCTAARYGSICTVGGDTRARVAP